MARLWFVPRVPSPMPSYDFPHCDIMPKLIGFAFYAICHSVRANKSGLRQRHIECHNSLGPLPSKRIRVHFVFSAQSPNYSGIARGAAALEVAFNKKFHEFHPPPPENTDRTGPHNVAAQEKTPATK